MKHSITNRFAFASIIAFVFSLMITANAFAAVDMFLQLDGISGEGTYKAKIDLITGNVEIKNVPAGHYKTTLLISQGAMASRMSSSGDNATVPTTIAISSFSWGATNSSSVGSGTGLGTGKVAMQDMSAAPGTIVSGYSLSSGGDNPSESVRHTSAPPTNDGGFTSPKTFPLTVRKSGGKQEEFYKVTFEDIIIKATTTSESATKPGYKVKANVKC